MIKSFKLFEELKRKVPADFSVDFTPETEDFAKFESDFLLKDDFVIDKNVAVCKEKLCSFEIKKINEDDLIIYELTIKDKDGVVKNEKKFRAHQYIPKERINLLDTILNVCAFIKDKVTREIHTDVDPYGEEVWDGPEEIKKPERDPIEAAYGEEDWDIEDDMIEEPVPPNIRDDARARMAHRHIPPADILAILQRDQQRRDREFERGREANIERHAADMRRRDEERRAADAAKPKKKGFYKTIEDFLKKSGPPSMNRRG